MNQCRRDSSQQMQGKKAALDILNVATLQQHPMIPQEVAATGQETKELMGRQQSEMEETVTGWSGLLAW